MNIRNPYDFNDDQSQEYYHDDANVMWELCSQFINGLSGKETQEELEFLINECIRDIREQATLMSSETIFQEILNRLPEDVSEKIKFMELKVN